MIRPEIRELQAFLALVKAGSFSAAAQQLQLTQPAVSGQILKLEQIVGFPLFRRGPEGTTLTDQGSDLVPFVEDIVREYDGLLHRAAYWKRSRTKQVKIWTDGSMLAQDLRVGIHADDRGMPAAAWDGMGPSGDWLSALKTLEVDIVVAGSFMKTADVPGISTVVVRQQRGVTLAWNPAHHGFRAESFSLPEAITATVILPVPSLAVGYREFLGKWCASVYGAGLSEVIECKTEADAVDACKTGLGVMIFPGDAEQRMNLGRHGLVTQRAFEFILPEAFTFGVCHRADEQNPRVIEMVKFLAAKLAKMG